MTLLTTIRRAHRGAVERIAAATGLTGEPLPNRPLRNRPLRTSRRHHDASRRRVLLAWQRRIDAWLRGRGR